MPVTNLQQIERFPQLSGKPLPSTVLARLEAAAGDSGHAAAGRRRDRHRAVRRAAGGWRPGLHFYTLNRSTATLEVFADLGVTVRRG